MSPTSRLIGLVGTYTKGSSQGIYSFELDTQIGAITNVQVAAQVDNPTYLAIQRDHPYLYSVKKAGESGGIAGYQIDKQNGQLTLINSHVVEGVPPCHLSIHSSCRYVVTANYHKGTVDLYRVEPETGSIETLCSSIAHQGSGPNKQRQEKPHVHYAGFTPDEKYVAVVDLGTDKLVTYAIHNEALMEVSSLSVKPGSGPRHLVFHPNKPIAYCMTELSSEVIALRYSPEDGSFAEDQYISTLPEGYQGESYGSAIHISADGRYVYAANRGHDSIALFATAPATGHLALVEHTPSEGNWPRDFALDPTERFLVCSNQNSGNLVLFARDSTTGRLKLLQADLPVPDPVCVKFLHV